MAIIENFPIEKSNWLISKNTETISPEACGMASSKYRQKMPNTIIVMKVFSVNVKQ